MFQLKVWESSTQCNTSPFSRSISRVRIPKVLCRGKPFDGKCSIDTRSSIKNIVKILRVDQNPQFEKLSDGLKTCLTTVAVSSILSLWLISPSAEAADALKTCICLVKECRTEFTKCLGDVKCAANIACLQSCNDRPDETECQIKCGDLFANEVVDEFNTCAVSTKNCVPQKQDENLYPVPPTSALVPEFSPRSFDGRWYISSGLNPIFDTFDCQLHEFKAVGDNGFDAKLTWRISTPDGGFFTRSADQSFVQDKDLPGVLYNHDNEFLHYQDDWYILAAQTEGKSDDFIFVYYRGTNDAWDGYGGAVVYSRAKDLPATIIPQLREAAAKVNLDFDKQFTTTDNTCGPEPPLLERLEKKFEKGEELVVEEIKDVGKKLEMLGKTEMKLLQGLRKGFEQVEYDEKAFLKSLTKEERELVESMEMTPAEVGELFKDAIPLRGTR